MTRSDLIASTRFQQSIEAIVRDRGQRRITYGLQATVGIVGERDLLTGDHEFSTPVGVTSPVRNLRADSQPNYGIGAGIEVRGGGSYVR